MKQMVLRTVALLGFAAILAFCLSAALTSAKGEKKSVYSQLYNVPAKARAERNPLQGSPTAFAAGHKLFMEYCAQCHGMAGEGSKRGPSLLASQVQKATPGTLFWILSNGVVRRGMPDWSKLPPPMRWQIIQFVKSLRTAEVRPAPRASR